MASMYVPIAAVQLCTYINLSSWPFVFFLFFFFCMPAIDKDQAVIHSTYSRITYTVLTLISSHKHGSGTVLTTVMCSTADSLRTHQRCLLLHFYILAKIKFMRFHVLTTSICCDRVFLSKPRQVG